MLPINPNKRMAWTEDRVAVENFWRAVGPREPMSWEIKEAKTAAQRRKEEKATQDAKSALAEIVGQRVCSRVYNIKDAEEQLWKPRKILASTLKNGDKDQKAALAHWIVYHWGRIRKGKDEYAEWTERLGDFSEAYVFRFAEEMKARRISSWSKVLSFADHRKFPIYDARTAVAVNVAIERTGGKVFLYMPGTQNTDLPAAIKRIDRITKKRGNWRKAKWNYLAFIFLLRQVVKFGLAKSILDAEATLFANAPKLATEWVAEKEAFSARRRSLMGKPPKTAEVKLRKRAVKKKAASVA